VACGASNSPRDAMHGDPECLCHSNQAAAFRSTTERRNHALVDRDAGRESCFRAGRKPAGAGSVRRQWGLRPLDCPFARAHLYAAVSSEKKGEIAKRAGRVRTFLSTPPRRTIEGAGCESRRPPRRANVIFDASWDLCEAALRASRWMAIIYGWIAAGIRRLL